MKVFQITAQAHQHKNQCLSVFLYKWFNGDIEGLNPARQSLQKGKSLEIKITNEHIVDCVRRGLVYLNQKQVPHLPFPIFGKCKILIAFPDEILGLKKSSFQFQKKDLLFEDDSLVAINKPSGLASQSTLQLFEDHALSCLYAYYLNLTLKQKSKGGRPPIKAPYLNLMHRLDKDTSGLLMFSKKVSANKALTSLFENRKIQKTYLAISEITIDEKENNLGSKTEILDQITSDYFFKKANDSFEVKGLILKTPQENKAFYFSLNKKNGQSSETFFKILKSSQDKQHLLLECSPKTGRSHQIRVHLKTVGFPILGDPFYNKALKNQNLCLHAWKLNFKHPESSKRIEIQSPIPDSFPLRP